MLRRIALASLAPLLAGVLALAVTLLILVVAGSSPVGFLETIFSVPAPRNLVNIVNDAAILFLAGAAVAIGFRMNLFNIGVEGQYAMAALAAAFFAGQGWLPGPLNVLGAIVVAMVAGAAWAGIAGLLKVYRNVSEVISTIMLNSIAAALVFYLLRTHGIVNGPSVTSPVLPEDSRVPGIPLPDAPNTIYGLSLLAVVVGVVLAVLVGRTRFGFDLRATGASPAAASASGVNVQRMALSAMLLSGGLAGLIGLPQLFGVSYSLGTSSFQAGLGFTGIAIALLGRNNPWGIAASSLLFAFLNEQSARLAINAGIATEIISITQGVIVLAVVIVYEVVRRYRAADEQRRVARQIARPSSTPATEGAQA